jgi:predicted kinase
MTHYGFKWTADKYSESDEILVKHIERKIFEHYIHNKKKILIVNTFLTKKNRKRFIDFAYQHKLSCGAILLNRPLDQCLERNRNNKIQVPENVIRTIYNNTELPSKVEGLSEVLIVKEF